MNHSLAGVLALLLATTHLHYTQNMMENNYIFLLTLIGFSFESDWCAPAAAERCSLALHLLGSTCSRGSRQASIFSPACSFFSL